MIPKVRKNSYFYFFQKKKNLTFKDESQTFFDFPSLKLVEQITSQGTRVQFLELLLQRLLKHAQHFRSERCDHAIQNLL